MTHVNIHSTHAIQGIYQYPTADISINKNRVKKYGNKIYLNDGTEFEIELLNKTPVKYLAKIKLNGKYISNSGIILRPGEHVFLERYIDSPKKFLFDTYFVDNNKTVKKAIRNNGIVEILFFKEYISQFNWNQTPTITTPVYYPPYYNTTTCDGTSGNITISNDVLVSTTDNKLETGRVERGSDSSQRFYEKNDSFNSYSDYEITYHLFPMSMKHVTKDKIRTYCPDCGRRAKKGWNFCAGCGTRI